MSRISSIIDEKEKRKKKIIRFQKHIKVLMTTTLVLLEKIQREEYNEIKKVTNVDWSESHARPKATDSSLVFGRCVLKICQIKKYWCPNKKIKTIITHTLDSNKKNHPKSLIFFQNNKISNSN